MKVDGTQRSIFSQAAVDYFSFLCELGFVITERSPLTVIYSRGALTVIVYQGRLSHTMGVDISYQGQDYGLGDIFSFMGVKDPEASTGYTALTSEQICIGLDGLAKSLMTYGQNALSGDDNFYQSLKFFKDKLIERSRAEDLYRHISPQANEAFRLKDYERAARLYEQILPSLATSENRKLDYAHMQMIKQDQF